MSSRMFIVITDYNGFSQTEKCLQSLRNSIFKDFSIVIVDHGNTDETRVKLAEKFPEVFRISGSSDLWWAGASNLGVCYALDQGAEIIMLLNNDCYVTPDTVNELFVLWLSQRDAIIAPVQRDWRSGKITIITPRCLFLLGFPSMQGPQRISQGMFSKRLLPTKLIAGGRGALIPAPVFRAYGLFDEKHLPHYWADHDFYLRVHRHGVPLLIASRSIVDIDNSRTTIADNPERLTLHQWIDTLHSVRSHRNLVHVLELFKRHYPVKQLYLIGVMLYIGRYFVIYMMKRTISILFHHRKKTEKE